MGGDGSLGEVVISGSQSYKTHRYSGEFFICANGCTNDSCQISLYKMFSREIIERNRPLMTIYVIVMVKIFESNSLAFLVDREGQNEVPVYMNPFQMLQWRPEILETLRVFKDARDLLHDQFILSSVLLDQLSKNPV